MLESVGPYHDLAAVAQGLYTALRALDARQPTVILARSYPTEGIGLAIRDRMVRAAEGRLIRV
jgi:L-threonylcarbamoyladenylate synthase